MYSVLSVVNNSTTSALIFDLDGTLVESLPGIAASLNRALSLHGLPGHSHSAVRSFIGDGAKMLVTRAISPGVAAHHFDSVLKSFADDYAISWQDGTAAYDGIPELLADLKFGEIPLAILSNKPHSFTVEIVEKLFPPNTFSVILGNREGMPHKPDPTGALEIAITLATAPENCILIGDSSMDLDTAKNAGMKSIAVTWGYQDRERLAGADNIVDSVKELEQSLA